MREPNITQGQASASSPVGEVPPAPHRGRLHQWLIVLLMAALVPLLALAMARARGALYLEINTDPEYAYLFNALRVAEGYSPTHIDHPGTPVQVIGAAAIRVVHAVSPRGELRDHVLRDPELFLRAFEVALIGVTTVLSLLAGAIALRATGSAMHAAAIQSSPLVVAGVAVFMDRPMPEPMMIGLGMLLSALVLREVRNSSARRGLRPAIALGAVIGVGTAVKMLFAPLGLIPLVAIAGWKARFWYLVAAAASLAICVVPITSQLSRVWQWVRSLATHSGRYGSGEARVVDLNAYPRQLWALVQHEPVYGVLAGGGVLVFLLFLVLGRAGGDRKRVGRLLLTVAAVQSALLLLVAKHPAEHYLASGASVGGLSICLIVDFLFTSSAWDIKRIGRIGIAAALIPVAMVSGQSFRRYRGQVAEFARADLATAEFMRSPESKGVLQGARISTPESALHFGNYFADHLYTADLERLHPDVLFWDWTGITAFGRPATDDELARAWSGGALRAVVGVWFDPHGAKPADLYIATIRPLGRERFVRATEQPATADGIPAFTGFVALRGLGPWEGPYPTHGMPYKVRWGLEPETVLRYNAPAGPADLVLEFRSNNLPGQVMQIYHNDSLLQTVEFAQRREFESVKLQVQANAGDNEIRIKYALAETGPDRSICVLFRKIQVLPTSR